MSPVSPLRLLRAAWDQHRWSEEKYSSAARCPWSWTGSTFIFQAQAPDGCFDCWNCVGRWVRSGRRKNGNFTLECAAMGAGGPSPPRDSQMDSSSTWVKGKVFPSNQILTLGIERHPVNLGLWGYREIRSLISAPCGPPPATTPSPNPSPPSSLSSASPVTLLLFFLSPSLGF